MRLFRHTGRVKGVYCLVMRLRREVDLKVGSLGRMHFPPGAYVYVGSAMGGVEQRVKRHKSSEKKQRWHIDYLLAKAEIVATIAIPSGNKNTECSLARAVSGCHEAKVPFEGFGSSDCRCKSHLFYFGGSEPEEVLEELSMRLSGLECIYPRSRE